MEVQGDQYSSGREQRGCCPIPVVISGLRDDPEPRPLERSVSRKDARPVDQSLIVEILVLLDETSPQSP